MNIDITDFRDDNISEITIGGELKEDAIELNGRRIRFVEPIKYAGRIYRIGKEKRLHIDIEYRYEESCGRCLELFTRDGNTVLSGTLIPGIKEDFEDDEDLIYHPEGKLDIRDQILESIILSLPMRPLCNEDCKGLCPKCGINHNKSTCNCIVENIDLRFAKLKDFFPKE